MRIKWRFKKILVRRHNKSGHTRPATRALVDASGWLWSQHHFLFKQTLIFITLFTWKLKIKLPKSLKLKKKKKATIYNRCICGKEWFYYTCWCERQQQEYYERNDESHSDMWAMIIWWSWCCTHDDRHTGCVLGERREVNKKRCNVRGRKWGMDKNCLIYIQWFLTLLRTDACRRGDMSLIQWLVNQLNSFYRVGKQ